MPTRRTRSRPRHSAGGELTSLQAFGLSHGWDKFPTFRDETDARETWEHHRDDFLTEWVESKPGERPYAWWRFDAPEGRLELNAPTSGSCLDRTDAGRRRGGDVLVPNVDRSDLVCWLEEESDYLERHDLFLPGERERLEDLDGPPRRGPSPEGGVTWHDEHRGHSARRIAPA
jgi:hypothetical protein